MAARLVCLVYRIGIEQLLSIRLNIAPDQASQVEEPNLGWKFGQLKGDFPGEADPEG